jgi:hypothetical protein
VFCQTQPVWVGTDYRAVRQLTCLSKDLVTLKPIPTQEQWDYYRLAVSDCGLALTGAVPIYQEFYRYLGRGSSAKVKKHRPTSGFEYLARGMITAKDEPSSRTRVSFWRAFGVSPDQQIAVEKWLCSLTPRFTDAQLDIQLTNPPELYL